MDISEDMDVNLTVKAPEKIASFIIYVKSDVLSPTIAALCANTVLPENGIATMDMLNDTVLIENLNGMGLGIPTGDSLKDKTEVDFSLSKLVPMINVYSPEPGSVHAFTLYLKPPRLPLSHNTPVQEDFLPGYLICPFSDFSVSRSSHLTNLSPVLFPVPGCNTDLTVPLLFSVL